MATMSEADKILYTFFKDISQHYEIIMPTRVAFRAGTETSRYLQINREALEARLKQGWTFEMLKARLKSGKLEGRRDAFISELIPLTIPVTDREDTNLLKPEVSYRHQELKTVVPAAYNEDDECIRPLSVRRVESFTLGELANYFNRKLKPYPAHPRVDLVKALRSTLNKGYTVDVILEAIDLWAMSDEENPGSRLQDLMWTWVRKVKTK